MHDHSDWNRLDVAAFRVSMKRSVRRLGWYLAVAGLAVVAVGVAARFAPFLVIGPVLAGAGIWNICRPSIAGLIVDGVTMVLTGTFHLLASFWMPDAQASSLGKLGITGLLQIVWGVRRLALYPTAHTSVNDPQAIARLEATIHGLSKRNAKDDPAVVEFRTGRFGLQRNRLGLYGEGVIGLLEGQAVRLEKRADIWIEGGGSTWRGQSLKVRIRMSDLELEGRMSAAHLERFENWKRGASQPLAVAA